MGDVSAEPSMEDILSSIKRIIAEEGEPGSPRARRAAAKPRAVPVEEADEVLELNEALPDAADRAEEMPALNLLSAAAAQATRGPLEALSRMVVKPEVSGADTLEGMVREMLRPMLRDWLDTNLPKMVEEMVAKEIARIAASAG